MSKHIVTINKGSRQDTIKFESCSECQTSCQSACKTSCTVANQSCANKENSAVLAGTDGKLNRNFSRK